MESTAAPRPITAGPTVRRADAAANEVYARQGMGQRIGFGERPAILLIDMQNDCCDPDARPLSIRRSAALMSRSAGFRGQRGRTRSRLSTLRALSPRTDRAQGCGG